jgi:vacuolar-type H+-ATPase subunit E/Vma4
MADELKHLIEKIQKEGVGIAETKAREIEAQARAKAAEIVARAEKDAVRIVAEAEAKAKRLDESTRATLKQAGRDLLIDLKKEIGATLGRVVVAQVREALNVDDVARLIHDLIRQHAQATHGTVITLNPQDVEKVRAGALASLKAEVQKGVRLEGSDEIRAGFIISFDAGRSSFDFTDKALAEHITTVLRPKLKEFLET